MSSTLEPLLRKLAYWGRLDAEDREAVLALPFRTKNLQRHGYIVRERELTSHSCLILSGFAIRHKIVAGGARQILAVQMKVELVDLHMGTLVTRCTCEQ